jgi:LAS superfamily LD-carboxypeptidase LdcB
MVAAFNELKNAALADGLEVEIASGFRNFERQLHIWENKFNGRTPIKDSLGNNIEIRSLSEKDIVYAIMLFSALPGASRHHWGCDIDVYAPNLLAHGDSLQLEPWEYQINGPFYPLSQWLNKNAQRFGFYFPYQSFQGGVAAEPWHLSYAPISIKYQQSYTEELLEQTLLESEISAKTILLALVPELYKRFISNTTPPNI